MSPTADDVVTAARAWVGTPWQHQGRVCGIGVDCIGLVVCVLRSIGAAIPADLEAGLTRADYPRNPVGDSLRVTVAGICSPAELPEPGTMILFRYALLVRHVGICTGKTIIHADTSMGRVVEQGYRHHLLHLTDSIWRLPGVDYTCQT